MQANGAAAEWRANWQVVLAGTLGMALTSVSLYSLGIFMGPLEAEFGWSRAEISLGITFLSVFGVVLAPLIGMAVDRFGARRIGVFGVAAYCSVFACLSLIGPSLWSWWLLWLAIALAAAGIKPTVWTAGISSLFVKGRGLAIAIIFCGSGLGSAITPIAGNFFIESYGWRTAYVMLGAFWALLVLPAVWLFFTSASDRSRTGAVQSTAPHALIGVSVREGLLSFKYIRMGVAAFLANVVLISMVSSLVPILISLGFSREFSAATAGSMGITTVIGRLLGGYFLDRINGSYVGGVSMLLPAIACGLLLLAPGSEALAIAAVLTFGFALGAELDAVAYLTTRHFGMKNFGTMFGVLTSLMALATAIGPLVTNHVYDVTASYTLALIAFIPIVLLSSLLFFSLGRYPDL